MSNGEVVYGGGKGEEVAVAMQMQSAEPPGRNFAEIGHFKSSTPPPQQRPHRCEIELDPRDFSLSTSMEQSCSATSPHWVHASQPTSNSL